MNASKPRYHLFGHVHEAHGEFLIDWEKLGLATYTSHFYNGAQVPSRLLGRAEPPQMVHLVPKAWD